MSTCLGITQSILIDCNNPPVAGTVDRLVLINKDDIQTITYDNAYDPDQTSNPTTVVRNIALNSGAMAYVVEGRNNSIEAQATIKKGRYFDTFEHQVMFKIFSNSAYIKKQIEAMLQKGNLVAVVENNFRGANGDAAFEVYGLTSGLEVTEGTRNVTDQDTQGGYALTLKTSEQQGEPKLPVSLVATVQQVGDDPYAATKTLVDGLLV